VVWKLRLLSLGLAAPLRGATEKVVSMTEWMSVLLLTWSTKVQVAELLAAREPTQAVMVPLELSGDGPLLFQPGAGVQETNLVLAGN
jgi:hypothetical protein